MIWAGGSVFAGRHEIIEELGKGMQSIFFLFCISLVSITILYFQNTSPSCRRFKKSATGKPFIPPFSVHGPFSEQIAEGWISPRFSGCKIQVFGIAPDSIE